MESCIIVSILKRVFDWGANVRRISRTEFRISIIMGTLIILGVLLIGYLSIEGRATVQNREDASVIKDERLSSGWRAFQDGKTGLYGFIDDKEEVVIEPQFLEAWDFYGGRAIVKVQPDIDQMLYGSLAEGVFGLINPKGEYVIAPEGLITRVDTWHYLNSQNTDFWSGYGLDGNSVIKRELIDGLGTRHGETFFYYVIPVEDTLFLANDGNKSFFINDLGETLDDYPAFYFPVTANLEIETIMIRPLDDRMNRMSWAMSKDGQTLEEVKREEQLSEDIQYSTQILSPYIGTSIFFPVFSMNQLESQSKLNKGIFDTANQTINSNFGTEDQVMDYNQIEQIIYTAQMDYDLTKVRNLINYEIIGYWYGFGAAHSNPIKSTAYFDVSSGEQYTLESLFDSTVDWRLAIAEQVDALYLETEGEDFLYIDKHTSYNERIKLFKDSDFSITFTESVMKVYYPIYEIAPYAASFPTFEIPYEAIVEILDEESGFYKALFD